MVTFMVAANTVLVSQTEEAILDSREDEVKREFLGDFGFLEKCCSLTESFAFRAIRSPQTWSLSMQIPTNGQQSSLVRDSS